jgi:hypothetical protein
MSPSREDIHEVKQQKHTPAYDNGFAPNTPKLHHLLVFSQSAVQNYTGELKVLSSNLSGLTGPGAAQAEKIRTITEEVLKDVTELTGGVLVIHEMMPVLIVAVVEAYLKDVLIYATGHDRTLMQRSGQSVTYQDTLNVESLEELLLDLRSKWARSFVDNGGPTTWIKSFEAMGARGYPPDTVTQMETLWDVRHLVVHSAGIPDIKFVRSHPHLGAQVGKRFIINNAHIKEWFTAMFDFVEVTDQYFSRRCQQSQ